MNSRGITTALSESNASNSKDLQRHGKVLLSDARAALRSSVPVTPTSHQNAVESGASGSAPKREGPRRSSSSVTSSVQQMQQQASKRRPEDFIFGKVIGDGSFSTVILAQEVSTKTQYAIKVVEKQHIIKEKKQQYIMREKEVLSKLNHPFFIRLFYTFQDENRLYFVLSYAKRGELLHYINKLGCFDERCTKFYAAEIVLALQYLHGLGIIHRDLKPENILLNEEMHIQITDFGSSKILGKALTGQCYLIGDVCCVEESDATGAAGRQRTNSFVGTAQYVSPEVLTSKTTYFSSDLWALGCIIYQLLSGHMPFFGGHEYQIFQKIIKLDYDFPSGFNATGRDLVQKLLVIDATKRLGCPELGGYEPLMNHPFFAGTKWDTLHTETPPELVPYLPSKDGSTENLWSEYKPGFDDQHLSKLLGITIGANGVSDDVKQQQPKMVLPELQELTAEEKRAKLKMQEKENVYHRFVEGHLIIKQGLIDKRKGLFARRRMFLLTEGPHFYYVDPQGMDLKGEIPWTKELRPEAKNFKIFFVHTPNRTYYLEDPEGNALKWCRKIEDVWKYYYGDSR